MTVMRKVLLIVRKPRPDSAVPSFIPLYLFYILLYFFVLLPVSSSAQFQLQHAASFS